MHLRKVDSMKAVITQPNFLPWIGYFHQLKEADTFIILDNVQYNKREWQNRNRIVTRAGEIKYLTVPVKKAHQKTLIKDMVVSEVFKTEKIWTSFHEAYDKTLYFEQSSSILKEFLSHYELNNDKNKIHLKDINVDFINIICKRLNWKKKIVYASDMLGQEKCSNLTATERLVKLCKTAGASQYLSSAGSRDYIIENLNLFKNESIKVYWQKFEHESYVSQKPKKPFVSHLTILDYLAHKRIEDLNDYIDRCGDFVEECSE
jgi:hypothetical protein